MAIAELVVLSSSPRGPTDFAVTPPGAQRAVSLSSSSPRLPSPSALFNRQPFGAFDSESRAARAPVYTVAGLTTAATLIASERSNLIAESGRASEEFQAGPLHVEDSVRSAVAAKRVTKTAPRAAKPNNDGETPAKRPRGKRTQSVADNSKKHLTADVDGTTVTNDTAIAAPAVVGRRAQDEPITLVNPVKSKKSRAKKEKTEPQAKSTEPRGGTARKKGAENGDVAPSKGKKKKKFTGLTSEHFGTECPLELGQKMQECPLAACTSAEGLALDEAMKRRSDWTPPGDTEAATKADTFVNLYGDFGYGTTSAEVRTASPVRSVSGKALTKRRRIELVGPTVPTIAALAGQAAITGPTKKIKAAKKKPTTITEVATTMYRVVEPAGAHTAPASKFFAARGNQSAADTTSAATDAAVPKKRVGRKSLSKEDGKAKKSPAKTKRKGAVAAPILLSPESAMKTIDCQDVIFGTSSQLAREESPTFIRDLQQAMRESEAELSSVDPIEAPKADDSIRLSARRALIKPCRSLWDAGRRDFNGGLLAATRRKKPPPPPPPPELAPVTAKMPFNSETDSGVFVSIDDITEDSAPQPDADGWMLLDEVVARDKSGAPCRPRDHARHNNIFVLPDESEVPRRGIEAAAEDSVEKNSTSDTAMAATSELRGIGEHRGVLQPLPSNINIPIAEKAGRTTLEANDKLNAIAPQIGNIPQAEVEGPRLLSTSSNPPKKQRGRSRKAAPTDPTAASLRMRKSATASTPKAPPSASKTPQLRRNGWTHIDEIEDSDAEPGSSSPGLATVPPISLLPEFTTPPTALSQPAPSTSKPDKLDWAQLQPALFSLITATVKSAPRSTDPKRPSWHEKMLLYDPIVLEDLTAWLSGRGIKVPDGKGGQAELKPLIVQKWCEEMSVCCLWREGMRGGVKNRY